MSEKQNYRHGFTLIELSIVLVIIGLIAGAVMVGQNLINAATVRAQISQIEKYRSAVNTFRGKYGGLPGDLALNLASQFGFNLSDCDGATQGMRDGNGWIEGYVNNLQYDQTMAETAFFWQDLVTAGLIDGQYPPPPDVISCTYSYTLSLAPGPNYVGAFFPAAKIGFGNFVYVYSQHGLYEQPINGVYSQDGFNWFGVSAITSVATFGGVPTSGTTIPVIMAANIDKKTDDSIPTSGAVQAVYLNAGGGAYIQVEAASAAAADSAATCYNTTSKTYSLGAAASGGANLNCALSFRFQ
jgi:prepilin-type N-terminal cleavage/methylation domain-containing protein